jgi:hypothetical protein
MIAGAIQSRPRRGPSLLRWVQPSAETDCAVHIAGVDQTIHVNLATVEIEDVLNDVPNVCAFTMYDTAPTVGQAVAVYRGPASVFEFAGNIVRIEQFYTGIRHNIGYRVTCQDYTFLLNRRLITKKWTSTSGTTIAQQIISLYTSGFTSTNVEASLPSLAEFEVILSTPAETLKLLADRLGASFYIDYTKDLHFFVTPEVSDPPSDIDDVTRSGDDLVHKSELSQVRTRVTALGAKARVPRLVPATSTSIVLDSIERFPNAAGTAICGSQLLTFTGASSTQTPSGVANAPTAPTAALSGGGGVVGQVNYRITGVTPDGETVLGAASGNVTGTQVSAPSAPSATASATVDGGLAPGTYGYKVTFEDIDGRETTPSSADADTVSAVPNAAAPNLSSTTTGNMDNPSPSYRVTFFTSRGETLGTGLGIGGLTTPCGVVLTIPTSGDGRVQGRHIYRQLPGAGIYYRVGTLNDNSTTTFTDTLADAALILLTAYPSANTTGGQIALTSIPTSGDSRIVRRKIYRTIAGGIQYFYLRTLGDNSTTSFTDTAPDTSLGAQAPSTNTTGHGVNLTSVPTVTGATARNIYRTTGGGTVYRYCGTLNDNSTTTFTDKKTDAELGQPSPVFGVLTGVPASSTGSIARDLEAGDTVRLYVTRNDTDAQTELAAIEGGDGIHEFVIDVGDETGATELATAADAELQALASAVKTITFRSRDVNLRSGKTITLDLGGSTNLSGAFLIQRVITTELGIATDLYPLRTVTAAPVALDFRTVLARVRP